MTEIICGDCIEEMKEMEENSIDSVVTDPPYNFKGGFMSKDWDNLGKPKQYQKWCERWAKECLRVLKPGGYMLAFSGTHSFHRLAVGVEDAGFVIKDTLMWLFGQGFPKSHNIGKAIDKLQGNERKEYYVNIDYPDSDTRWDGWGTALKPAHEPIVLAQKPYEDTYAENVLKYGVGGLNIDGCRIGIKDKEEYEYNSAGSNRGDEEREGMFVKPGKAEPMKANKGRWPANVILDPQTAQMLDEQSGVLKSGARKKPVQSDGLFGKFGGVCKSSEGGASRFFYCAKAHKSERNAMSGESYVLKEDTPEEIKEKIKEGLNR